MTPRPQTERILAVLADNEWHSFDEIKAAVGAPFSMLERRGELKRMGYEIERRGEWYRLLSEREQGGAKDTPVGQAPHTGRAHSEGRESASIPSVAAPASRSENSQLLSPRPVASPPPSARRATPFLCVIDESGGQDPDFWTQNSEWSVKA